MVTILTNLSYEVKGKKEDDGNIFNNAITSRHYNLTSGCLFWLINGLKTKYRKHGVTSDKMQWFSSFSPWISTHNQKKLKNMNNDLNKTMTSIKNLLG